MASSVVVLYPPQLERMAVALTDALGASQRLCTDDIATCPPDSDVGGAAMGVVWETFPSASTERDPNTKVLASALIGKHVVLLISQDVSEYAFAQLSLALWLQRFLVPNEVASYAAQKWKDTVPDGEFSVATVGSLSIVIPWYRYCQMERTQRWTRTADKDKPWDNKNASGPWLDVPTAHTYAALLSAEPPVLPPSSSGAAAPPPPPKRLLLIDIHDDLKGLPVLEGTFSRSGKWANATKPYDLPTGSGTFFASAFHTFLTTTYAETVDDVASVFIVFPDGGAFARFAEMVKVCLRGITAEQILFIEKSRVGTQIAQTDILNYIGAGGEKLQRESFPAGAQVLIPDDFTNSGSTLFGAGTIVRKHAVSGMTVAAFVSHFVAKYDRTVVNKFVSKLYSEGDNKSDLDAFYTTDTVACSAAWLREEVAKRDSARATVMSVAPVIAAWLQSELA